MTDKPKAIIMGAGRGTRISREISDKCKCTLDIGGISLIRHTVQMLLEHNIAVHLVVGFHKQQIMNSLVGLDVTFHENVFYSITNSLASLWFAREELKGDTVILGNADVFWENNLLSVLLDDERDCVMLCDSSRAEEGDYLFNVIDGRVINCGKGTECMDANCEYVGLAKIQGKMIGRCREQLDRMIDNQRCCDWWEQILYDMKRERPVWVKDISGHFWAEIDFIEDYKRILAYRGVANE
jgi:choline kinase